MAKVIAITGKGGTGKTLLAALIIRYLKRAGKGPVLAIDADPDANLTTVLGVEVEKTIGDLREETLKAIKDFPAGMSKAQYLEAGLHELIVETEQVDYIVMGRSEGPDCYCYVNNMLRNFSDKLQPSYDWVVMDNEAGLEHLSRRTASKVDSLVAVVNENPLSWDCARRIDQLVTELKNDVKRKFVLLNGVKDSRIDRVREKLAGLDFTDLGVLPHDSEVEEMIFSGESLFGLDRSPAILKIEEIMQKLGA